MLAAVILVLALQDRLSWTFDDGQDPWRQVTYSGQAAFTVSDQGRTGKCLAVSSQNGADASWSFDAPVKPGEYYKLSGWVKAEGVTGATGALFNVHQVAGATTKAATGDDGWTQVETVFRTGARTSVQINCLFGGWGQSRGRAFYDDVVLERIDMTDFPGAVTIDVTKTREPISKYIYGQFIEHLGRCIYGGIWAEMLEDRKFYYPIEGKEPYQRMREGYDRLVASPWVVPHTSRVDRIESDFRSQPVIKLYRAMMQNLPAVVPGKYVFRVTYRGSGMAVSLNLPSHGGANDPYDNGSTVRIAQSSKWTSVTGKLDVKEDSDKALFVIESTGSTEIAAVSLIPADNIDGFRRDTIELLKELDAPIYRWPGGNFVSGYEWRDGIGDRDKRPTIPNPAWTGIDTNDMGTHEFIRFCELIGTEPLIVVNTGFGDPFSAAQWVEYCNSIAPSPRTEGSRGGGWGWGNLAELRKQNGSDKPFNVKWWGIGNEMYGSWQLGHVPVAQYVTKHNMTVDRMKAVDPTIKTIAVGETGPWDEAMLRNTRHNMDLLSEHIYVQERQDTIEHTRLLPEAIRRKADWHRRFQPTLQQEKVKISMDEWNYWYGPYLYGELGTRYFWKDGMGIAAGLHEFFRNTDVYEMAQYAQTVNVIGAIKTTPTHAEFETTGLVLMLYRKHFGTVPVSVEGINPDLGLDIVAALTADRKTLTIAIVNPFDREITVPLRLAPLLSGGEGSGVRGSGKLPVIFRPELPGRPPQPTYYIHSIAHNDPMAYNEPGQPRRVNEFATRWEDSSKLTVPKLSVTIARIPLQ